MRSRLEAGSSDYFEKSIKIQGVAHYVPVERTQSKTYGHKQYQVDHAKAKDTFRNVLINKEHKIYSQTISERQMVQRMPIKQTWLE